MSSALSEPGYAVVVPVKRPAIAKSRLSALGDRVRRELVVAFAADTITAALGASCVSEVLAVTDDHQLARDLSDLGADVIPDGIADDLNGSLVLAVAEAGRRWPDLRVAALCADLPALRSAELSRALSAAPEDRQCFVCDKQRSGTTLLVAPSPDLFEPRFGNGSREAHLDVGAAELDIVDVPTLRRDVDTTDDLADAIELGVGSHTAVVASGLRL
jgi:2-phospho-L-lactate guanylyltransferase